MSFSSSPQNVLVSLCRTSVRLACLTPVLDFVTFSKQTKIHQTSTRWYQKILILNMTRSRPRPHTSISLMTTIMHSLRILWYHIVSTRNCILTAECVQVTITAAHPHHNCRKHLATADAQAQLNHPMCVAKLNVSGAPMSWAKLVFGQKLLISSTSIHANTSSNHKGVTSGVSTQCNSKQFPSSHHNCCLWTSFLVLLPIRAAAGSDSWPTRKVFFCMLRILHGRELFGSRLLFPYFCAK